MLEDQDRVDKLDKTDYKILRLLQNNGRLSNAEISKKVHVSTATCFRRTQRLYEQGYIQGVRANINPELVDRGTLVMVGVVLDSSTPESFAAFEDSITKFPDVLDCHLVAGDFDYFLKIRVKDMNDFNKLHSSTLLPLPGVRQLRTFFVMKEVTSNAELKF